MECVRRPMFCHVVPQLHNRLPHILYDRILTVALIPETTTVATCHYSHAEGTRCVINQSRGTVQSAGKTIHICTGFNMTVLQLSKLSKVMLCIKWNST